MSSYTNGFQVSLVVCIFASTYSRPRRASRLTSSGVCSARILAPSHRNAMEFMSTLCLSQYACINFLSGVVLLILKKISFPSCTVEGWFRPGLGQHRRYASIDFYQFLSFLRVTLPRMTHLALHFEVDVLGGFRLLFFGLRRRRGGCGTFHATVPRPSSHAFRSTQAFHVLEAVAAGASDAHAWA